MKSEYDNFAQDFSQTRTQKWEEFDIFLDTLSKNDRLLDLGCGNGRLRKFIPPTLIPEGNYFGFDLSEKLLDIARKNFPNDPFFRGDFSKGLPFGADNFDCIVGVASFHHLLNRKDQQTFFESCYRVLKPGGKIFLTTWILPQKYFWYNLLRLRLKNWIIPFGKEKEIRTYRHVNIKDFKHLSKKNKFKIKVLENYKNRNLVFLGEKY